MVMDDGERATSRVCWAQGKGTVKMASATGVKGRMLRGAGWLSSPAPRPAARLTASVSQPNVQAQGEQCGLPANAAQDAHPEQDQSLTGRPNVDRGE